MAVLFLDTFTGTSASNLNDGSLVGRVSDSGHVWGADGRTVAGLVLSSLPITVTVEFSDGAVNSEGTGNCDFILSSANWGAAFGSVIGNYFLGGNRYGSIIELYTPDVGTTYSNETEYSGAYGTHTAVLEVQGSGAVGTFDLRAPLFLPFSSSPFGAPEASTFSFVLPGALANLDLFRVNLVRIEDTGAGGGDEWTDRIGCTEA